MKITKEKDELVLRIPLKQNSYDAIGDLIGKVPNLIGVSDEENYVFTISQLCNLAYKGTTQEGIPYIYLEDKEELKEVCKEFGFDIWYR